MGKRGPAKKPTAIKELQGNPGRRQLPKNEPQPEPGAPTCPKYLDGIGRYSFKALSVVLADMKVLTHADKTALSLLCDAYAEYRRARAVIIEQGATYQSFSVDSKGDRVPGIIRPRPEVKISAAAWKRCADMLRQFGLTPSSRQDVEAILTPEKDPLAEFQAKGKKLRSVKGGKK